jgi:uncharacterized protein YndB with AHSA1/START domain
MSYFEPRSLTAEKARTSLFRRVFIGAPAEVVWEWLWEPARVEQYGPANLEARPAAVGDPVRYLGKLTWEPVSTGTVEELVEGRRLVHTFEMALPEPDPPSRVTYELIRYGEDMCCLELRHDGLLDHTETFNTVSQGWDVTLSSVKPIVETGKPLPWPARRR